jgi:hypothetical protein
MSLSMLLIIKWWEIICLLIVGFWYGCLIHSGCLHLRDADKESMFMTHYNMDLNQRSYFVVNKCIKIFEPKERKNGNIDAMSWLTYCQILSQNWKIAQGMEENICRHFFNVTKKNPHSSGYAEKRGSRSKGHERATHTTCDKEV